jgi:hypothetical protein
VQRGGVVETGRVGKMVRSGRLETVADGERAKGGQIQTEGQAQKTKKPIHERECDGKCRFYEMTNQDNNNLNERNYNLKTPMKWSDSPNYEHCKDEIEESRGNQKSVKRYNHTFDETNIQREMCFSKPVLAYD